MNAAAQLVVCTKCSEAKSSDCYGMRLDRGVPYRQCRDCMNARKWAQKNPDRMKAASRAWQARNPERTREIWREMAARKRANGPAYRLHSRISNQVWQVLRDKKKGRPTFTMLGYAADQLKAHIERQFVRGMGWHNMDEWHIDHIIPLSSFTITGPDDPELRRAWSLTNLRPLWAKENMQKSDSRTFLI